MSNPLSLSGARIIDPILTNVARGYTNMALVFAVLFPIVMVGQRGGKIVEFKSVWGKNVILAYSSVGSLASQGTPSFGYTYRLNHYPMVEVPYFNKEKLSWMYPVITEDTPVIAGKDAGVLLTSVVG